MISWNSNYLPILYEIYSCETSLRFLMFSTFQNDRISMMHVHTSELVRFNFAAVVKCVCTTFTLVVQIQLDTEEALCIHIWISCTDYLRSFPQTLFLQDSAERAYRKFVRVKLSVFDQNVRSSLNRCGLCGVQASSFQLYRNKFVEAKKSDLTDPEVVEAQKVIVVT